MAGLAPGIDNQSEPGQQFRRIDLPISQLDGPLPVSAAAAIDDHVRTVGAFSWVQDPILAYGWHRLVQADVSNEVLLGIPPHHFSYEYRTEVLPAQSVHDFLERNVLVRC